MEALFPDVTSLSRFIPFFFAPFFLRTGLGLTLFFASFNQLVHNRTDAERRFVSEWPKYGVKFLWAVGVSEVIIGLSFVAGLWVQHFALISIFVSFIAIFSNKFHRATKRHMTFYVLTFVISISLFILGAGKFSLDGEL